ncbi:glutathione-dependent disulfide-bond oxidoreductase [Croceicoccus naphthovorans]|uniref:S-transferase n=1 Tax=Croceicoccus naphthovorans TaxID=1348774 RepID=A0A0G3XFE9_9SPHN|nr:glutathione-dependent disulfide-bond oxidoreductase [Croceicoccus naphthovorans]AKM09073.1 S-transferase [Croceicoccus naphthovorans]MBB3992164.1 GST-like protein [Croceicoccus naphthovorans]
MTEQYTPPEVWTYDDQSSGEWTSINRPTAGARSEKDLPVGQHPFQLYSLGTPNGQKVGILFEELLAAGHAGAEYDAWLINIGEKDQFTSGFVGINPNSKIPALVDRSGAEAVRVFESGAILIHLAEKFGAFLPSGGAERAEVLSWLMWQMGSAPFLGGGFGHFYAYAPYPIEYAIDRYAMETKRQLDVLDQNLANREFVAGDDYSIADMAIWPWYGQLALDKSYKNAGTFLSVHEYTNLQRWAKAVGDRMPVQRGTKVNAREGGITERHSAADLDALFVD